MSIFFLYLRLCQELYGFAQGWEIGSFAFLSFVDRDTHPTCTRCRGNVCASDRFCDICAIWLATQWELFCRRVITLRKTSSRPSGSVPSAPPTSPRGNFFGSFASWDFFFFFFFPPLRRAGEAGGVSGCTWCFVWGGFLPSRFDLGRARRVEVPLGCRLGRAPTSPSPSGAGEVGTARSL